MTEINWIVDNLRKDLAEFLGISMEEIKGKLVYEWCTQLEGKEWRETGKNYSEYLRENTHDLYLTAEWHIRPEWKECYENYWGKEISQQTGKGKSFCDFGCGIGTIGIYAILAGWKVTFVDINKLSIQFLKFRLKKYGLKAEIKEELDGTECFDWMFLKDVIGHLEFPVDVMIKIVKCIRKGGWLEFTWDNFYNTEDGDVHRNKEIDFHGLLTKMGMRRRSHTRYVKVK